MATPDGSPVRSQNDERSSPNERPRHYTGLKLTMGVLSILVGILVLARPVNTLFFVAVLFGVQLLILGMIRIALGFTPGTSAGIRVACVVLGVITIIAGVICFIRPNASLFILALLLAFGWIADGIADLFRAFSKERSGVEKAFVLLLGVVSIAAGLVVAFFPRESLVLLAQTAGVALLVIGALTCGSAIVRRRPTA